MKPRLKTSLKGTDFPADYIKLVRDVITKNFKTLTKKNKIIVDGKIYLEEITMRIGFLPPGSIKQMNFEASVSHSVKSKNTMDQIYLALDALGSMIGQYLESKGSTEFPTTWQEFNFDKKPVHLKTSTENSDLEAQANEILGADPESED